MACHQNPGPDNHTNKTTDAKWLKCHKIRFINKQFSFGNKIKDGGTCYLKLL